MRTERDINKRIANLDKQKTKRILSAVEFADKWILKHGLNQDFLNGFVKALEAYHKQCQGEK